MSEFFDLITSLFLREWRDLAIAAILILTVTVLRTKLTDSSKQRIAKQVIRIIFYLLAVWILYVGPVTIIAIAVIGIIFDVRFEIHKRRM